MKKRLLKSFLPILLLNGLGTAYSQCPASITGVNVSTTAANCPSTGTATIASNLNSVVTATYTITAGPVGAPVNVPQSSRVFNALPAGNYTVKLSCDGTLQNTTFTIADNYPNITAVNTSVTTNCGTGSFAPGGTISVNNVNGGSGTLRYKIVKTDDQNFPESQGTYGTVTTFNVSAYGNYQVRVIDQCNQYFTQQVSLQPDLSPIIMTWAGVDGDLVSCSPDSAHIFGFDITTVPANNIANKGDYFNAGGFKLAVWEQPANGSCPSSSAGLGAPLYETTVTSDNITFPIVPSGKYVLRLISPCGDTTVRCSDMAWQLQRSIWGAPTAMGCAGNASNPAAESISGEMSFMNYPVKVYVIKSSTGVKIDSLIRYTADYTFSNLPQDEYIIRAVDACGNIVSANIPNPVNVGPADIDYIYDIAYQCINNQGNTQTGTRQMEIAFKGFIPDMTNAVVTIISGPSNVGINGWEHATKQNTFYWNNMLPGNYLVKITTGCANDTLPFSFTPGITLAQNISVVSTSFCSGGGNVFATTDYNGSYPTFFVLQNLTTNALVDSNSSGNFTNIPPGNYRVKLKVQNYCGNAYYPTASDLTITPSTGPEIIKRVGVACEDVSGNPTTGSAYLTLAGPTPRLIEYKPTSSSTWITLTNSNVSNDTMIGNLLVGQAYDVRVTACGIAKTTQVVIEQLSQINLNGSAQPCLNTAYTLSLPDYSGATYEWRNPSGVVITNAKDYFIASYNTSYDGTYTATISWNGCVTRTLSYSIYGNLCGQTTTSVNVSGNVFHDPNGLSDSMVNGTGIGLASGQQIYASMIKNGVIIASTPVAANGTYDFKGVPAGDYSVTISTNALGSITTNFPTAFGWVNTGEHLGLPTLNGNDGTVNGNLAFTVAMTNVTNVNFAIEQRPVSYNEVKHVTGAPIAVSLNDVPLEGSDADAINGAPATQANWSTYTATIETLPTNGFVLTYNGATVVAGQIIQNYNPALLSIAPGATTPGGTNSTSFTYTVTDQAGVKSIPTTYTVTFTTPLPVDLADFAAKAINDCSISVTWNTLSERNVKHFVLQRSADAQTFANIATINAKGLASNYHYMDQRAITGRNYYRIKIVDNDAAVAYGPTASVATSCDGKGAISVYPTVTANEVFVSGLVKGNTIRVYNAIGQLMITQSADQELEQIHLNTLPSGIYHFVILSASEAIKVKVVKP
ncbi:hypothetical protein DBR32_00365 [Taibaiella sp. KBW10]|uniref:T9SS type A sorting domain-containing protein n=1 Tax=Taibaiella sp. KBW10 TaxID=2153357 RepID=UPI000F5B7D91|nr:T9SS type A sorting domain-containing protein [Taibaiella sp. KBW10]RQO32102.1 hypothetical protein DBR32_00365 [Taibaiella sp. KBW10]